MNKEEFEKRIKEENLISIHDDNSEKVYTDYHKVYNKHGIWINNMVNIFGCFDGGNEESVIFITDEERGIPKYISKYGTIGEAYDGLYKKITTLERIYKKKQKELE